jgi:hypothetical protein
MKKVLLILLLLVFSVVKTANPESPAKDRIKVGVFYYPWYVNGYQNGHWSGNPKEADPSLPATWWTVVDRPVLDWYDSNDTRVIRQHLDWFAYAHIDFGIISWWGPYHNDSFYDNDWVKTLFDETENYAPWFRWVILVEPCYTVDQSMKILDTLRNYVFEKYTAAYHDIWLNDPTGKPFLFWTYVDDFNNDTVRSEATNDTRFETRLLGQFLPDNSTTQIERKDNIDWYTWSLFWGSNNTSPFPLKNGSMCVLPRYDETRLDPNNETGYEGRMNRTICCDPRLDGSVERNESPPGNVSLYDQQWSKVLSNASAGNLDYVLIGTWNDFTERTQIEPCYDLTSTYIGNTTYLLDRTKYWINQLDAAVPNQVLNITNVEWQPNASVTPSQDVEVDATVTDSSHNIENVWLRYTTNATTGWNYTSMNLSLSNVYQGTIPPQQPNSLVNFTIIAFDNVSNCLIDGNNGNHYGYIVVPEFSSFLIIAPIMIVASAAAVCGRKRRFSGRYPR